MYCVTWDAPAAVEPEADAILSSQRKRPLPREEVSELEDPVGFVLNHLNDGKVVGAVLRGPGFLSGLSDEELNLVRVNLVINMRDTYRSYVK